MCAGFGPRWITVSAWVWLISASLGNDVGASVDGFRPRWTMMSASAWGPFPPRWVTMSAWARGGFPPRSRGVGFRHVIYPSADCSRTAKSCAPKRNFLYRKRNCTNCSPRALRKLPPPGPKTGIRTNPTHGETVLVVIVGFPLCGPPRENGRCSFRKCSIF